MSTNAKELIFEETAREKLKEGIDKLGEVVGVTLGPQGRNVGLQAAWGAPNITNDGNSIVKDIEFKDQYLNMGAAMAKEIATKMKEKCGDGTTTTLILMQALVKAGVKNIASGSSPISLKRGMDKALEAVIKELAALSIPIQDEKETKNIAVISASGNQEIGNFIAAAIKKAGKQGVITIEEGKSTETFLETTEGMTFERGYISAYFATKPETRIVEMNDAKILVTDKKITTIQDMLPILESIAGGSQELLIIAEDVEGDALSTLVVNKIRGTLKVCAVKAPGFGDTRKAILEDIAILTGGTLVSEEVGISLKEASFEMLGHAEKVIVSKDKTTIVGGQGSPQQIQARIQHIENEIKNSSGSYEKEKLEERKAKLSGGVVILRVGASTETQMKQEKQMFEDSLNSTQAALEQGIVIGGGIALLQAAAKAFSHTKLTGEELTGARIIFKACEAPFRQIVKNTGKDDSVILEEVLAKGSSSQHIGFNALTEKVEDLMVAGVVDPFKIVSCALQLAVSVASIVLMTETLVGNAPDHDESGSNL